MRSLDYTIEVGIAMDRRSIGSTVQTVHDSVRGRVSVGELSNFCLVCPLVVCRVLMRRSWEGSTDRRGSRGGGGATSEQLSSLETHAGDVIRKEPMRSKRPKAKDFVQDSFHTDVEQPQERKGLFRLLQEARGEQKYIMWALVLLLLGSAVSFLLPAIAASSVDILLQITNSGGEHHEKDDARRRLNGNFALMLSLSIFSSICSGFRGYLFTAAGERLVASVRARLFASLLQQEVAFHDDESTGSLLSRLSEDTLHIKDACTVHLSIGARNLLTGILSMAGMIFYSWQLSLVALMMMPALFFLIGFHSSRVKVLSYQVQFSNARAMATASESFMAIKMVKAFRTEQKEGARYEAAITEILQLGLKYSFAYGVYIFVITLASVLGLLLIMWYGSILVLSGSMTIGTLIGFAIYAFSVVGSLTNMGATVSSIAAAVGSSQRVWELMDRRPQIKHLDKLQPKGHPEGASVSLENVWFSYPSRPSQWVLQDLTIEVKPGTKTALVGPSGGGKTTVVNLIERFFDPNKGLVKFDDVDIRKLDDKWLHKNMGIVSQDPILFGDTIAYNITYAVSEAKCREEDMIHAAKLANAHDFIMKLPQGYNTVLGEHGAQLSGGQRQRIAIARAILMQPRLLLLDEATSALDSETESLVEEALNKLMHGRTVLVIAHRLSTVVNAHQVILIHEGKVQEQGNHAELLDKNGMYAALVQKQLLSHSGVNPDIGGPYQRLSIQLERHESAEDE